MEDVNPVSVAIAAVNTGTQSTLLNDQSIHEKQAIVSLKART